MISITKIAKGWDQFFYEETRPTSLVIFRVLFGLINILNAISLIPDALAWFGVRLGSTLPLTTAQTLYTGVRINAFNWLAPTDIAMWTILIGYLIASIAVTVGLKTKRSAFILFVFLISIQNRNFMILNSGDTVLKCLAFLMIFAPSGAAFSVDSWLNFRKTGTHVETVPITTIRLMQLQFSLVYLATFWFKAYGDLWVDGSATYYTARLLSFQRVVIPGVFDYLWSVRLMTWSALAIEFALGTLIWIKELRYIVVLAGIALHIGIELTMSIGFFEWMMLISFVLFVEANHFDKVFTRILDGYENLIKGMSPKSSMTLTRLARKFLF